MSLLELPLIPAITCAYLLGTHLDEILKSIYQPHSGKQVKFLFQSNSIKTFNSYEVGNLRLSYYFILSTDFASQAFGDNEKNK